jgi:hypothetical protein
MDNNKDFIIVGSMNAITYKEVFKYIKNNTIQIGFTHGRLSFDTPERR